MDFPSRKSWIVPVGIRAILDPRTRPIGLVARNRSLPCLFGYNYRPCTFLCLAYPSANLLTPFLRIPCRWHHLLRSQSTEEAMEALLSCFMKCSRSLVFLPSRSSMSAVERWDPRHFRVTLSSTSEYLLVRPCRSYRPSQS